jgi:hypothetical protein
MVVMMIKEQQMKVVQNIEQALLISELAEVVAGLPKSDNIFAGKMIRQFDHLGKLSLAQERVVREILARNDARTTA